MPRPIFLPRQPFRIAVLLFLLSALAISARAGNIVDAARAGDAAAVKSLLTSGVPVDQRAGWVWLPPFFLIQWGETALCAAAGMGRAEIVKILLEAGADRTKRCGGMFAFTAAVNGWARGVTPLMIAVQTGNQNVVRALLDEPAGDQARDLREKASLYKFDNGLVYTAPTCEKLGQTSDCNADGPILILGIIPVHLSNAAVDVRHMAREAGHPEMIPVIDAALENSPSGMAPVTSATATPPPAESAPAAPAGEESSLTPLATAARDGNLHAVDRLIAGGTPLDATDSRRRTALMWASYNGHADIAQALMAAGASVNLKDNSGMTALMLAARGRHADCIKSLILGGADLKAKDNEGRTALDMALAQGGYSSAVVQALQNSGDQ